MDRGTGDAPEARPGTGTRPDELSFEGLPITNVPTADDIYQLFGGLLARLAIRGAPEYVQQSLIAALDVYGRWERSRT